MRISTGPRSIWIDRVGRCDSTLGEGAYEDTERRIRRLLGETVTKLPERPSTTTRRSRSQRRVLLGYERLARFANGKCP